jgi:PAS domain S-box-containing protein
MFKSLSFKHLFLHVVFYAGLLAVLAALLPWFVFIPLAVLAAATHFIIAEARKRSRYQDIVASAKNAQIESYPVFETTGRRGIDELLINGLRDVSAELEKKCYQLVEKNIQLLSLKEISLSIISSLDESRIVDSVRSFLSKGLGFKEILVGILGEDRDTFRIYTFREAFGESRHHDVTVRVEEIQGMLRKSVLARKPILIRDPEMHPIGTLGGLELFESSTMNGYLLVPMIKSKFSQTCWKADSCILKNQVAVPHDATLAEARCPSCSRLPVLGLIGVTDGFKAASLSQVDLVAVETLALQISTLLENSQLYHELKAEESFRENIINSMMNGLITTDTEGKILLANETVEDLTGYTAEELTGMSIERLVMGESERAPNPVLRTLKRRKKAFQREAWLCKKTGKKLPIALNTSLLLDEERKVQGALGVFIDMTKIKRMEEKIMHLDKLAALGRFSSSMAHEIRNPLTGIVAGLQYLRRVGGIPEEQNENITFILKEVNRIDRLISDILNVVRGGELVYHPVQVESLIRSTITVLDGLAKERNVKIKTRFPEKSRTIMVDSDRIVQVLINLLRNAVEASSPGGEVRVSVSFPSDISDVLFDDIRNLVIIEVEDDGVGFSEEAKAQIFEPFFTTKAEGTGLGLYVTHSIVERHGGYIFVESEKGKGAVFTVYLPVEKVQHGDSSQVSHPVSG